MIGNQSIDFYTACGSQVGFDNDNSGLSRWTEFVWQSDYQLLVTGVTELQHDLAALGVHIPDLDERGLRFLCFRTSFVRTWLHPIARGRFRDALIGWISIAASLSGHDLCIPVSLLAETRKRFLLGGTNLFVDARCTELGKWLELRVSDHVARAGGLSIPGRWLPDRILFDPGESPGLTRLSFDEDFVFFYRVVKSNASFQDDRRLIATDDPLSFERKLVNEVRNELIAHIPAAWNLLRAQCLYLNWSSAPYMDSSSDLRESRGSILLNPRRDQIACFSELTAWAAQGLYHEAKHWQFFDTYRSRQVPGLPSAPEVRLSNLHPKIPCSWKALPSARTLEEHLLALQAFIPGLIAALRILNQNKSFSTWIRGRLELEMRSTNGAMSTLIIGKTFLTEEGHALFETLLSDYESYLIPAYAAVQDRVEQ